MLSLKRRKISSFAGKVEAPSRIRSRGIRKEAGKKAGYCQKREGIMKILVVEDEVQLLESIAEGLRLSGYVVDTADNGRDGEELCYTESYDLMILDINLPGMDGFEVLKKVREYNKTLNIILLTARSDVSDRVKGLDFGANDYMVKPFYFAELEARIRSLLRRKAIQTEAVLCCGALSFDTLKRRAYVGEEELKLTKKELGILEYLLLNMGSHVTQYEILEHVWGDEVDSFSNTVRVHMASLRKKIKTATGQNLIENVIGKGYMIDEDQ
ncbi:MAG: response regulator transcription factor [Suipraeoptans intestinalis]|nr:response regulator transcription factor [Suipraeoptans intestinalis]